MQGDESIKIVWLHFIERYRKLPEISKVGSVPLDTPQRGNQKLVIPDEIRAKISRQRFQHIRLRLVSGDANLARRDHYVLFGEHRETSSSIDNNMRRSTYSDRHACASFSDMSSALINNLKVLVSKPVDVLQAAQLLHQQRLLADKFWDRFNSLATLFISRRNFANLWSLTGSHMMMSRKSVE